MKVLMTSSTLSICFMIPLILLLMNKSIAVAPSYKSEKVIRSWWNDSLHVTNIYKIKVMNPTLVLHSKLIATSLESAHYSSLCKVTSMTTTADIWHTYFIYFGITLVSFIIGYNFPMCHSWKRWHRSFNTQAIVQDVSNVLNENYVPISTDDIALFPEKQKFLYAVLESKFLIYRGKAIIHAYSWSRSIIRKSRSTV